MNTKILNLIKNKPTGGNPVNENNNNRNIFFVEQYFCKNKIDIVVEFEVKTVVGICIIQKEVNAKKIIIYKVTYNIAKVNIIF